MLHEPPLYDASTAPDLRHMHARDERGSGVATLPAVVAVAMHALTPTTLPLPLRPPVLIIGVDAR